MTARRCPQCGARVTVDPSARVTVAVISRRPLRSEAPRHELAGCELLHCTRCEWSEVLRRIGPLPGRRS